MAQGHCTFRIVDMLEYNVKGGKMNRGLMATWNFAAPDIGFVFVSHVPMLLPFSNLTWLLKSAIF